MFLECLASVKYFTFSMLSSLYERDTSSRPGSVVFNIATLTTTTMSLCSGFTCKIIGDFGLCLIQQKKIQHVKCETIRASELCKESHKMFFLYESCFNQKNFDICSIYIL